MVAWIWVFIPILGILCGMLAIYTEHRQKMAMIEKGIKPEDLRSTKVHRPEDRLVGGLVVMGIGLAFLVTQISAELTKWIMFPGFILLFIGIALIAGYYLTRKIKEKP